jgi:hypothetical protein
MSPGRAVFPLAALIRANRVGISYESQWIAASKAARHRVEVRYWLG